VFSLLETGCCPVAQAGLGSLDPPASASLVLELQAWILMPSFLDSFEIEKDVDLVYSISGFRHVGDIFKDVRVGSL
jgi:hypothetical protein